MNNLDNLLDDFNGNIALTETYKLKIRTGRDSLRNKINNFYIEKNKKSPVHSSQGSFRMHTAVMPLEGEDFDLDNGVYLQGYSYNKDEWPTPYSVHQNLLSAVEGHTKETVNKPTCVRVNYQDNYHIDLPAYILGEDDDGNEAAFLAHTVEGWVISDPKAFSDWFTSEVKKSGKILRYLVRYLKSWAHYKNINISGMAITILASECYIQGDSTQVIFLETLISIIDRLDDNFSCLKPVRPKDEDLFSDISYSERQNILDSLKELKTNLNSAIYNAANEKEASEILRTMFGVRFPLGDSKNVNTLLKTNSPENVGGKNRHFA